MANAKKLLLINASPRRGGNIDRMITAIADEARRQGADVQCMRVDELDVAPCRGCMACRSQHSCVLPADDAQRMAALVGQCDALVIGAPCYWGNIPGTLKVLLDRMVYAMIGEGRHGLPSPLHKGKRAAIVATSTTAWPWCVLFNQTRGAVRALRQVLHYSGFKIVASVQKGGTRRACGMTPRENAHLCSIVGKLLA